MRRTALPVPGTIDLSASMMCADPGALALEAARLAEAGIDSFHFDIMDGHFVPNLALSFASLAALRPVVALPFAAHLMVEKPENYLDELADVGADLCIFHVEASRYPRRLMRAIADAGMAPGIAINPATPISALDTVADIACVMVMSVEPGFAGAELVPGGPARVRGVRALCGSDTVIGVDGHIDPATAESLRIAGADLFVCGTKSIFRDDRSTEGYATRIGALRLRLDSAKVEHLHG
jgi:ribulose-phosphate 3-epimerase